MSLVVITNLVSSPISVSGVKMIVSRVDLCTFFFSYLGFCSGFLSDDTVKKYAHKLM
jgi:hypothetical protein